MFPILSGRCCRFRLATVSQVRDLKLFDLSGLLHAAFDGEGIVGVEVLPDVKATVKEDVPAVVELDVASVDIRVVHVTGKVDSQRRDGIRNLPQVQLLLADVSVFV